MPLPGSFSVADEFRVSPRTNNALQTRIEQKRQLNKETNPNNLNPSVPDWLQASHPLVSIPNQDNQYGTNLRQQGQSIDDIGKAANEATASAIGYQQQAAAARALAQSQASQERNQNINDAIGKLNYDFGDFGMDGGDSASGKRAQVIAMGKRLLGQPYQWGGGHGSIRVGPVDCSGLVKYAFSKAGFGSVPEVSQTQMTWGKRTSIGRLLPGDLVGKGSPAHHVAIYLGNGKILEAQQTGTRVHIRSIKGESGWWGVHLSY